MFSRDMLRASGDRDSLVLMLNAFGNLIRNITIDRESLFDGPLHQWFLDLQPEEFWLILAVTLFAPLGTNKRFITGEARYLDR